MEAVAPDPVALVVVVGKSVHVGLGRDGRMVGGVEHRHLWDMGQDAQRLADPQQRRGIVQRSERGALLDLADQRRGSSKAGPVK